MQNFIKTIINAIQSWTKGQIDRLIVEFNNRINASKADWNENDPSADNYIKNRTHWEEETTKVYVPKTTIKISNPYELFIEKAIDIELVVGQTYTVIWNDEEYKCVCYDYDGAPVIGNNACWDGVDGNGEPFLVSNYANLTAVNVYSIGTYTISIFVTEQAVHKLDTKYLPDDIGVQPDWEQSDSDKKDYIKNKPFYSIKNYLFNDTVTLNEYCGYNFENRIQIDYIEYGCTIDGVDYSGVGYYDDSDGMTILISDDDDNTIGWISRYSIYLNTEYFEPNCTYNIAVYTDDVKKIDSKFLPEETDPTVPEWAKQSNKPNYTVDEISGAAKQTDIMELQSDISKLKAIKDHIILYDVNNDCPYKIQIENGNLISSIAASIDDFVYTANDDGTYTITGWDQTYFGDPSTEMVFPDDGSIII